MAVSVQQIFSIFNNFIAKNIANWQLEKSNERNKTEKTDLFFQKNFNFWISTKKLDALKSL